MCRQAGMSVRRVAVARDKGAAQVRSARGEGQGTAVVRRYVLARREENRERYKASRHSQVALATARAAMPLPPFAPLACWPTRPLACWLLPSSPASTKALHMASATRAPTSGSSTMATAVGPAPLMVQP